MEKRNYIGKIIVYRMPIAHARYSYTKLCFFLLLALFYLSDFTAKAQDNFNDDIIDPPIVFDEIPVLVLVEGCKGFYVDMIYTDNDILYINIEDLFKTLQIPCIVGEKGNSISGFIENESRTYLIDYHTKKIIVGDKTLISKRGLVKEMDAIYMESTLFNEAFGISMTFNYRSLSIVLKSNFELPLIKQKRIEKMRNNISKLKAEVIADTILPRNYHLFKFGMLDWALASSQSWKGKTENQIGLGIGTELLYGEANLSINYSDKYKFNSRQLQYLWRWVDNDKLLIKQAQIGKISNQSISYLNGSIIGVNIRNSPTTVRTATGFYIINEITEPNWTVELYINNVLVDYTKADASGSFQFKVPNVYGYTTLKLKFYGPMGEERIEERTLNVPFTFTPEKEFEYSLTAGILQDETSSRFGKAEFNYGVDRMFTVGGGLEYLSTIPNNPLIPFAKFALQPFSKLTIFGEYAHGVKTSFLLNYYLGNNATLEIDYTKFVQGQLATRNRYLEERKVKLSAPFKVKNMSGYAKLDYTQLVYSEYSYNQASIMLSAYYKQFSTNSTTQINKIDRMPAYVSSNLSLSYRIRNGFSLRSSAQYNITEGQFITCKAEIEKRISKGYLSASYGKYFLSNDYSINISFKYDLPFARTNISTGHSRNNTSASESAQGSIAFGSGNNYIHKTNNSSVGKGGISIYPFLDLNHNGVFDDGEKMVKIPAVRIMGGKVIFSEKDSIVRIPDLSPFINYVLEFSDNDLENIAWQFKNKIFQVLVDPNQFKRIDIPIIPVGEASGMTYLNQDNSIKGIGRIMIKFYNKSNEKLVAETLSESDGYIDFMGFEPGDYIACVDSVQLSNLNFKSEPMQREFTIKTLEEGDIVEGIDFVLRENETAVVLKTDTLKNDMIPIELDLDNLYNSFNDIGTNSDTVSNIEVTKMDTLIKVVNKKEVEQININLPYKSDSINSVAPNNKKNDHEVKLKNNPSTVNNKKRYISGDICFQTGNYYVQCGAFKYKNNAVQLALKVLKITDAAVGIIFIDGLYKVQVGCVTLREQALEIKNKLIENDVHDELLIMLRTEITEHGKNKLTEGIDSINNNLSKRYLIERDSVWGEICNESGNYFIQCGAYKYKGNAVQLALKIMKNAGAEIGIIGIELNEGLYKVQVGCTATKKEAEEVKKLLIEKGLLNNIYIRNKK